MKFLRNQLKPNCFQCGVFSGVSWSGFCDDCQRSLEKHENHNTKILLCPGGTKLIMTALYQWERDISPLVSTLIMALKKGKAPKGIYDYYAHNLWSFRQPSFTQKPTKCLIVPAPASRKNFFDHAARLAQSLQALNGGEMAHLLVKTNLQKNQNLNRLERQRLKMECKLFPQIDLNQGLIFVDDVVSTGATAERAYLTLGKPKAFEILCIAHRQLARRY